METVRIQRFLVFLVSVPVWNAERFKKLGPRTVGPKQYWLTNVGFFSRLSSVRPTFCELGELEGRLESQELSLLS